MRATIMLANIAAISTLLGMFLIEKDMSLVLMAFSLLGLGLLGEVAANEQESFDKAYTAHYFAHVVQNGRSGKYIHSLYEQYKYVGYDNNKAFALMQEEANKLEVGELWKPFTEKASLTTRVLLTQIRGNK